MPVCAKIRTKNRQVCIGDLRDLVTLNIRSITPPSIGSVDFGETFTQILQVWAATETVNGQTVFDGTDKERIITHKFYIRYEAGITFEDWIEFEGINFVILDVEDLDNRHEFQLLRCSSRGIDTQAANLS